MQADLKEKFILLSKVAKEKKYAQEYLGLLARRGDIGSIRIGKRWYTTWEWFEEFLETSQKKKEEAYQEAEKIQIVKPEIQEIKVSSPTEESGKIRITLPLPTPEKEMVPVAVHASQAEKTIETTNQISINIKNAAIETETEKLRINISTPVRKMIASVPAVKVEINRKQQLPVRPAVRKAPIPERKISVEERNSQAVPYREIKIKKNEGVFSPDIVRPEKFAASFFPKFAFAVGFAIMLFLMAVSGYFIYSGGLFKKGIVAGASDERNAGFAGIKSEGDYYLISTGDKMKESLSISRVMVEVAREQGTR